MSWWSDLVAVISTTTGENTGSLEPGGPAVSNATASAVTAGGLVPTIEGIWAGATDGKLWRSLGWLLLGIVLMLLGALWWIGPSAERASPGGTIARGLT